MVFFETLSRVQVLSGVYTSDRRTGVYPRDVYAVLIDRVHQDRDGTNSGITGSVIIPGRIGCLVKLVPGPGNLTGL